MNTKEIKYLILFLFVSISQTLFSQENNKFRLTVEYSPNYSMLTDEVVNERFKLSHNALFRISYNSKGKLKPTIGLGFLNTGELERSEIGGQLGTESVKFIQNHNYLMIPIGFKYSIGRLFILPEIGFALNISNKTRQITEFSNGETERETRDMGLNSGEFNKLTIPFFLSIGTDLELFGKSFSTGLKGYYGLNHVVNDVPRNNHYFGFGIILAMNL
jgi:hypothetical protein